MTENDFPENFSSFGRLRPFKESAGIGDPNREELQHYVPKAAITEGLGRRIKIVGGKSTRHLDLISEEREGYYDELDKFSEKVIERRKYLRKHLFENRKFA